MRKVLETRRNFDYWRRRVPGIHNVTIFDLIDFLLDLDLALGRWNPRASPAAVEDRDAFQRDRDPRRPPEGVHLPFAHERQRDVVVFVFVALVALFLSLAFEPWAGNFLP